MAPAPVSGTTGAGGQDPSVVLTGEYLPWEVRGPLVERLCHEYGVPDSVPVIQAMIDHESGGRIRAVGDGGESLGLLQLHARGLGNGMTDAQRFDPEQNLRRGIDYHARYLRQYDGDMAAAITAHNAGGRAVNEQYQLGSDWRTVVHRRDPATGRIVYVKDAYTLPVLHTARTRYGYTG